MNVVLIKSSTSMAPNEQIMTATIQPNFSHNNYHHENHYWYPEDMNQEQNRLNSYNHWPLHTPKPQDLAKAGLYYLGNDDFTQCAFCGIQIGQWEPEDDPIEDHKKWSPLCRFVLGQVTDNVPRLESDACGIREMPKGQIRRQSVIYPTYAQKERRIQSFKNWPIAIKQKPSELAEAGFYYTGKGDQTVCFYCGVGLKYWEENDDPWEEHEKSSPDCTYVQLKRKDAFSKIKGGDKAELVKEENVQEVLEKNIEKAKKISINDGSDEIEAAKCKICLSHNIEVVFLPCKHLASCVDCAVNLKNCPICRQEVENYIRVYLS